jgi:hypothetical protein
MNSLGRIMPIVVALGLFPALATADQYIVRMESFHIDNTRARHEDTDAVSFGIKVAGRELAGSPLTKGLGDVNNGDHPIDLQFGPFDADPANEVAFNYTLVNNGHDNWSEVENALRTTSKALFDKRDGTATMGSAKKPDGSTVSVWGGSLLGSVIQLVVSLFLNVLFADCDGIVAADQVAVTGADLAAWTARTGSYMESRYYPGTDSNIGCGSNSQYSVVWTVTRVMGARPTMPGRHVFTIRSASSGKVLDVEGASRNNGARVIQWDFHGGPNQRWAIEPLSGADQGYYRIRSLNSGKCLDVSGISTIDHAPIVQWDYVGGDNQKWQLVRMPGSGEVVLRAKHSGKVVNIPGASQDRGVAMQQYPISGQRNERWILEDRGVLPVSAQGLSTAVTGR